MPTEMVRQTTEAVCMRRKRWACVSFVGVCVRLSLCCEFLVRRVLIRVVCSSSEIETSEIEKERYGETDASVFNSHI